MFTASKYSDKAYPFPNDEINPKDKDDQWCREYAEAIYSEYLRGESGVRHGDVDKFERQRLYGQGRQPKDKYQNLFSPKDLPGGNARRSFMNLDWEIFSPAPKYKAVLRALFENRDFDVIATAIDELAGAEKEDKKWGAWFTKKYKPFLDGLNKKVGLPNETKDFVPGTKQELEIFAQLGGFKLKSEQTIEKFMDYTLYLSNWKEVKRKMMDDLIDFHFCACMDYTDLTTGKVKCEYLDPAKITIAWDRERNFEKAPHWGYFKDMRIVDLRKIMPEISEDEWVGIARMYDGYSGNTTSANHDYFDSENPDGKTIYDNYKVSVFFAEWFSINTDYKNKVNDNHGRSRYVKGEYGVVEDGKKVKTKITPVKVVYKCNWIVGTEYVFDAGLQYNIPRVGMNSKNAKSEPRLSIHAYKINSKSFIETIEQNLDQIELQFLKLQNAIAKARPSGLAIEIGSLQNLKLGAQKMPEIELLRITESTGHLLYKGTTHRGQFNTQGKPIQELQGGIGPALQEAIQVFEWNFQMISELTGINRIMAGGLPDPKSPVRTTQEANANSEDTLTTMFTAYTAIKESVAVNTVSRMQCIAKYELDGYEGYYKVFGESNMQTLKIGSDIAMHEFGIKIEARPNAKMREEVSQAALLAMQPDKDGTPGLELPDYLMIMNIINNGNLKYAQALMAYKLQKIKQAAQQEKDKNILLQSEQNEKLEAIKGQNEQAKLAQQSALKKEEIQEKGNQDRLTNQEQHQQKMAEIAQEVRLNYLNGGNKSSQAA